MISVTLFKLFSHAEDLHGESTSDIEHLLTQPYVAVPLFLLGILAIYLGMERLKIKLPQILLTILAYFLVVGIGTYTYVPVVSIFSLSFGILLAMLLVMSMILED